jgi:undecaprenyl diphosphate synthase
MLASSSITKSYYSPEQLANLDPQNIPRHIAIIPDGNRRWARKQGLFSYSGHRRGADILIDIVRAAKQLGVRVITFYLFSTENWARHPEEIEILMKLIREMLIRERQTMLDNGVRACSIGDLSLMPLSVREIVEETKIVTAGCSDIDMIMALNYGSRDEICRATRKIVNDCQAGKIRAEEIDIPLFSRYLDTAPWRDPDLWIRTSGELRLSNYLLWQSAYAEIHISDRLWPDFNSEDLYSAIKEFQERDRRLGGG